MAQALSDKQIEVSTLLFQKGEMSASVKLLESAAQHDKQKVTG
jgi:hypothetical protein